MITSFRIKNNKLLRIISKDINILSKSSWIDLINPNKQEKNIIEKKYNQIKIKNRILENLEKISRCYKNQNGLHIDSFFFYCNSNNYSSGIVTKVKFRIFNDKIFITRKKELLVFRLYRIRNRNKFFNTLNIYKLFLDLFEIKIEQMANDIDIIYKDLEYLSTLSTVSSQECDQYNAVIADLGIIEAKSSKIRFCLMDTQKALFFFMKENKLKKNVLKKLKNLLQYIELLISHNEFAFEKIMFLTQLSIGFIDMEQNKITKIFSIISTIFLPPALVTSMYGMNFKYIPELKLKFGYALCLLIMSISALIPYIYFKRKKWI